MKNQIQERAGSEDGQLIAVFGEARLVRVEGRIELRGGSMCDRIEALEWMSLFLPEEAAGVKK